MTTPDPFAAPDPTAPRSPQQSPPYGPPPQGQPYGYGAAPNGSYGYGAAPTGPYGYGAAPTGPYDYGVAGRPAHRPTNGMAVASMVLGILWLWWIGSVLALVFGYLAKRQIRERGENGGGMATAGIVLGYVGVGFFSLFVVLVIVGAFADAGSSY